jgi:pyruvate ferredoxin oxidoreductase gamma subunit
LFEIRVHGLGGQGAVTMCTWLAQAAYDTGKHVQAFPFFGAERRGAPVKAFVRLDDNPIYLRSQVYHPDLLLVMSADLMGLAIAEGISPEGRVLVNARAELALRLADRFAREVYYLDATGIALDLGLEIEGMPMVNLPLFGALASQSGAADLEGALSVVREVASRKGNLKAYEKAAKSGFEGVMLAGAKEATVS